MFNPSGLHVLTDVTVQNRFSHLQLAEMAAHGGASVVQYREKRFDPIRHLDELRSISLLLKQTETALVVNDYAEWVAEVDAAAAHIGQNDLSPQKALETLPPPKALGVTVHFANEYFAIEHLPLAYIGVGPVFGSKTKNTGLPPLGLKGLAEICALSRFPVVAIGNIQLENVESVLNCGAKGVAVVSAFCCAPDPKEAAQAFVQKMSGY